MDYEGIIIEESLEDTSVLDQVEVLSTDVQPVTGWHQTPWLTQWTLRKVRVAAVRAASLAEAVHSPSTARCFAGARCCFRASIPAT